MKQILLICAVVAVMALVGCGESAEEKAAKAKAAAADWKVIEAAIRKKLKKPTGELTKADLEKVTRLGIEYDFGNMYQLTSVKGLEKLTQLKTLKLSHNQLTDVKGLEKLTQLKELWLPGNQLTDVGGLEKLTQLTVLTLGWNQLTELSKGLEKLTQLKELSLAGNQLTDVQGLEKLTKLKVLHLNANQLTDVQGLEKLTKLEELSLHDNPDLTKAQIDQLQKALPNGKISSDHD